jgi:hypothetical protein
VERIVSSFDPFTKHNPSYYFVELQDKEQAMQNLNGKNSFAVRSRLNCAFQRHLLLRVVFSTNGSAMMPLIISRALLRPDTIYTSKVFQNRRFKKISQKQIAELFKDFKV